MVFKIRSSSHTYMYDIKMLMSVVKYFYKSFHWLSEIVILFYKFF